MIKDSGREVKAPLNGFGKEIVGSAPRLSKLVPERVAEALDKFWPNVAAAAHELGVYRSTFQYHKDHSPWFQRIYAEIEAKHTDRVEAVLFNKGVSGDDYTFNDRIAYLRAHRPELYDRAKVIKLEDNRVSGKDASGRTRLAQEAIDAQIVEGYRERKGLKALRKAERTGGGRGETGAGEGGK